MAKKISDTQKLAHQLITTYTSVALILIIIANYFHYDSHLNQVRKTSKSSVHQVSLNAEENFNSMIIKQITSDFSVIKKSLALESYTSSPNKLKIIRKQHLEQFLQRLVDSKKGFYYSLKYIDINGKEKVGIKNGRRIKTFKKTFDGAQEKLLFDKTIASGADKLQVFGPFRNGESLNMRFAIGLSDPEINTLSGILMGECILDNLLLKIIKATNKHNYNIQFYSPDNVPINIASISKPDVKKWFTEDIFLKTASKDSYIKATLSIPYSKYESLRNEVLINVIKVTLISIFFIALISAAIAHITTKPLNALADATKKIKDGNLEITVPENGSLEITELAKSFNSMSNSLKDSFDKLNNEISTRKEFASKLKKELNFINTLIDTIPSPLFYKDKNGVYLGGNEAFCKAIGIDIKKLPGSTVYDVAPPEKAEIYKSMDQKLLDSGGRQNYESPVIYADGEEHNILFEKAVFLDENGNTAGLIGVMTDLTKIHKTQEILTNERKQLLSIFNSIPERIHVLDIDSYEILFVNDFCKQQFADKILIGETCHKALYDFDEPCSFCTNQILLNEPDKPYRWEYHNPETNKTYDIIDRLIKWSDGRMVKFELAIDITNQKHYEKELQTALEKARRSNRDLEQFAYVASHDLQEPLRVIKSYLSLIYEDYAGKFDEEGEKWLNYVVNASKRMQNLIRDLLTYSRINSDKKEHSPVNIAEIINYTLQDLNAIIKESKGTITIPENLPFVKGNGKQINQVFQNIIQNALKYHSTEELPLIEVSAEQTDDNWWQFTISDNGIGIKEEYAERVFNIFQRLHTKDEYQGTGIGLAVCQNVIEKHGGKIWCSPNPEKGTSFYFTLPAFKEEQNYSGKEPQ